MIAAMSQLLLVLGPVALLVAMGIVFAETPGAVALSLIPALISMLRHRPPDRRLPELTTGTRVSQVAP